MRSLKDGAFRTLVPALALFVLASAGASAAPRRLALLVGINTYKYPAVAALNGCVNDVQRFRDLLIGKFGFAPEDIVMLTNDQAGRDAIVNAFRSHLIAKASPGDEALFYYSGHGSTAADSTQPSGHDQTIVPWDSRDPEGKVFDITDQELRGLFGELKAKTSNITAILDSCHSGTAVRGARARSIPEDTRPRPQRTQQRGTAAGPAGPADRGILFIAGSRSDQVSFEHFAEGADHGAMSWFLARELSSAAPDTTWRDVMDRVRAMVSARYPLQEPQLEGSAADKLVLGGAGSASQPYYLVSPRGKTAAAINAGAIHGLSTGSVFDVYKPGTKDFTQATPVAQVQLAHVTAFDSDAQVVSGGPIDEGSRAIERARQFADFRFRIYWDQPNPARDALVKEPQFEMLDDPARADMLVRTTKAGIVTAAADGTALSPPLDPAAPDAVEALTTRIRSWAKWYQTLTLDNPDSQQLVSLKIEPVATRADGRILNGDKLRIVIRNNSPARVFVALLDLARSGSISVVPLTVEGANEQVAAGGQLTSVIEAYVPDGQTSASDYLKVFATKTAMDFRMLTTPNIRDIPSSGDPLARLFVSAMVGGARDVRPVTVTDWATATRQITVLRE